jgi:predicted dehydrogenase
MAAEDRIRVGVIGLGVGQWHLQRYAEVPGVIIQALCDQNTALLGEVAAKFNVPQTFTNFEKMLEKAEVDAVTLAVPNFLHKSMTIAALEKGWHVLCEKPMALTTAEALEMRAKVRQTGRKFMIHFNQRFRAEHQFFKAVIDSGKLGDIYYASTGWRRMRGIPRFGGWFGQKKMSGGGPLIDLGVHMLDLTRWLIGNPRAVTVSASTYSHLGQALAREQAKEFDVEDLATALIRFDNGASLVLEVNWALNFEEREKTYLELSGIKGGLSNVTFDYKDTTTCIFREENGAMVKTVPLKYPPNTESAQAHFIRSIREDFQPEAGADEGVEIMRILDAIYASALDRREVVMKEVDFTQPLVAEPAVSLE